MIAFVIFSISGARCRLQDLFINYICALTRPPDKHVGGLIFYRDSFFFHPPISKLAERNSTISGRMVGSKCNLKMHVRNLGYPFPLQIGGPKPPF